MPSPLPQSGVIFEGSAEGGESVWQALPDRFQQAGLREPMKARRALYLWLSIEMAAGIIALAEVVFVLPSVILLRIGGSLMTYILPITVLSAVVASYLAWRAFPLVGQVASLGRRPS